MRVKIAPTHVEMLMQEIELMRERANRLKSALQSPKPNAKLEVIDVLVHEAQKALANALYQVEDNSAEGLKGLID